MSCLSLESRPLRKVGRRLIRSDSYHTSDRSVKISYELASTLTSMQDLMVWMTRRLDQLESSFHEPPSGVADRDETVPHAPQKTHVPPMGVSYGAPFQFSGQLETAPPHATVVPTAPSPTISDIDNVRLTEQEARMERLKARMRQVMIHEGGLTWDDRDGIPKASLPLKFRMPNIERYSWVGDPKGHLRLYFHIMRAHGFDDTQLVALFPMSLNRVAQRWFGSVEPSSAGIVVSRRELKATR